MKGRYLARKPLDEMIGEGFREIGVLVLVFATLDGIIAGHITLLWMISSFYWACFCSCWAATSKGVTLMNEYSSFVMGFGFFTVCFAVTLAHIRWTKKQAAKKALSTPQKAEFLFKTEGGEDRSARSASLAHR